jgi:DMSO/TMAO reductase YedYZ molybdopterin-dependent catalytic subunit
VLVLSVIAGLVTRKRFGYGAGLLALLVLVAAAAAIHRPGSTLSDLLPSAATAVLGVGALWLLVRPATGVRRQGEESAGPSRRGVLITAAALAVTAAAMGTAGRLINGFRSRLGDIALPAAADPAPAFPTGIEKQYPGISALRTATADFYRVDTRLDVPIVDAGGWKLKIDGRVQKELELSFDDLLAMPLIERDITLTCVSNSVGGPYVGGARWLGVRLTDLLDQAGVRPGVDQIFSTDVDGMTIGTPYDLATDGRDAMIAVGMNGAALPREHGFPARMVVPGLYGFISACKWIERITLTTYADQDSYWTKRKWATDAPVKISSRIDTPKVLEEIKAGDTFVGGVAWAQENGGVAKVDVQIDGGAWQPAMLGPSAGNDYWRQWYFPWSAEPGTHRLACRVTDGKGQAQTAVRAEPFPSGASGIQTLIVTVR